jgi:hypothetical protein
MIHALLHHGIILAVKEALLHHCMHIFNIIVSNFGSISLQEISCYELFFQGAFRYQSEVNESNIW